LKSESPGCESNTGEEAAVVPAALLKLLPLLLNLAHLLVDAEVSASSQVVERLLFGLGEGMNWDEVCVTGH